jgi:RNA polymerase sigma-70 factor (ECF subfamily)
LNDEQLNKQFYARVWPYRADVLRVAQYLCRDHTLAEDLAQETLLKAFRALKSAEASEQNLKKWLLTILRNTWKDRLRTSHPASSIDAEVDQLEAKPTADAADEEFWKDPQRLIDGFADQQIIDALKRLPEEIRWTLLLVDVEGIGIQDAAEVLQVPSGTVKSRAHRGRAMLRQILLPLARERRLVADDASYSQNTDLRPEGI